MTQATTELYAVNPVTRNAEAKAVTVTLVPVPTALIQITPATLVRSVNLVNGALTVHRTVQILVVAMTMNVLKVTKSVSMHVNPGSMD